jgi:membrane protein implicated in regulation of membrane protease activity
MTILLLIPAVLLFALALIFDDHPVAFWGLALVAHGCTLLAARFDTPRFVVFSLVADIAALLALMLLLRKLEKNTAQQMQANQIGIYQIPEEKS